MSIDDAIKELDRPGANIRFRELLSIAQRFFGPPRIKGSHHVFKMPWPLNPRINLQQDGSQAKPYQIRQVVQALKKLKEQE